MSVEPIFVQLLAFREKMFGAEHHDIATTLSDLANLYVRKGEYTKAEPRYQRALTILGKTFGTEHRDVGDLLGYQARLYEATGTESQS